MKSTTRRAFLKGGTALAATLLLRRYAAVRASPAASFVVALWSGALTSTSARVNARIDHDSSTVRLLVSPNSDLSSPLVSGYYNAAAAVNNRMVSIPVSGLTPDTQYYYGIESGGVLDDTTQGKFKTPAGGPQSFTLAFASCANTGSTHAVFDNIRAWNPLFFIHMGDMHYENIATNSVALYRAAYDSVLASSTQAALYRNVPLAYMWDDHDYGPNDSDSTSPGRQAARLTHQEYVPHYPLAAGSGDVPIYQSFAIGRVYFILTDLRSERSPKTDTDDASKTMLGSAQKAWFKNQLLAANGRYAAIVWVNTTVWIGTASAGTDQWTGYTTERQELANFIKDNQITGLLALSGDAHMLAADDGTNSDYATGGGAAFPVFQAAALDRTGIVLGGPYSEGTVSGGGQFGLLTITDNGGDTVGVAFSGRDSGDNELIAYSFNLSCCLYPEQLYLPVAAG